jgi:hypothetical protein
MAVRKSFLGSLVIGLGLVVSSLAVSAPAFADRSSVRVVIDTGHGHRDGYRGQDRWRGDRFNQNRYYNSYGDNRFGDQGYICPQTGRFISYGYNPNYRVEPRCFLVERQIWRHGRLITVHERVCR